MYANPLFGILNLGHWDLFDIWILVLGILIVYEAITGLKDHARTKQPLLSYEVKLATQ